LIAVRDLFESHLNVGDLQRSMNFFGQTLGLELAEVIWKRRVAFYWIGGRGNSMLGLWESGTSPQRLSLHIAFRSDLSDLLSARHAFEQRTLFHSTLTGRQPTNQW
jgi:lactoylglutathione lyase